MAIGKLFALNANAKNVNRLVTDHFSISSVRNKFDSLKLVKNNLNVFMITETKLDQTFPEGQFIMDGFTAPHRMDRNTNGGGIGRYTIQINLV